MAEITSELGYDRIKIKFGGVLHLLIVRSKFVGMQSWRLEREGNYVVEYTMIDGTKITCEYDSPEKWRSVLAEMDKWL
jgi:hypothetical protein